MQNNKKATPNHENSLKLENNISLKHIEIKALERLLLSPCNRFELEKYTLSSYAPNTIKALRNKGFIITTKLDSYLRSDGKTTRIGFYYLQDKSMARDALAGLKI